MPRRQNVVVSSGRNILRQFCWDVGIDECASISLFDHHNVIDEMKENEAKKLGVDLDHLMDHRSVLLSYGHMHRRETFYQDRPYFPMVAEMDGYIFTDTTRGQTEKVAVYQHEWMRNVCDDKGYEQCTIIGMTGDKGQAASLLGKPAILFDDKEDNVCQVLQADIRNKGCVVRIGSRSGQRVWRDLLNKG